MTLGDVSTSRSTFLGHVRSATFLRLWMKSGWLVADILNGGLSRVVERQIHKRICFPAEQVLQAPCSNFGLAFGSKAGR